MRGGLPAFPDVSPMDRMREMQPDVIVGRAECLDFAMGVLGGAAADDAAEAVLATRGTTQEEEDHAALEISSGL
eukprot:2563640-Pyramimonas_sp.AAC.2